MKALFLLTLILVASGTNAGFLDGLKNVFSSVGKAFATTGKTLLGELDNVGGVLFNKVKDAGKNLLSQGLQSLALNTMTAMKPQSRRREANAIVEKLTAFEKDVVGVIDNGMDKFKVLLADVIQSFHQVIDNVKDLIAHPSKITEKIDTITGFHSQFADALLTDLVTEIEKVINSHFNTQKRNALTDALKDIGVQLSSVFKPAVEGFKNMVHTTGSALKEAAGNIATTLKSTLDGLGSKVAGFVDNHVLEPTIAN